MRVAILLLLAVGIGSFLSSAHAMDVEAIVAQNERAVLVITGTRADNGASVQGSGVCISTQGHVLATAHQVINVKDIQGRFSDGKTVKLSVLDSDASLETAILISETPLPCAVPIGDADQLKSGAALISIAAPMNLDFSTVPGTVSNPNRTFDGYPVIQVVLTAGHGSSGGPVFDKTGALVGLISGQLKDVDFTIVNRINNYYPLLAKHNLGKKAPLLDENEETELAPSAGISETELRALAAYNRGVQAASPEEKSAAYRLAVQLLPQFYEAWFNLGVVASRANDSNTAIASYEKAKTLRPQAPEVHRNLGRIYLRTERLPEALAAFEKTVTCAPNTAPPHNDLGEAYRQMKKTDLAIAEFQTALNLQPDYAPAHYNLGITYANAGNRSKAIEHFQEYLRLCSDGTDAAQVKEWINTIQQASK